MKGFHHGIDLGGRHVLKGANLQDIRQETISQTQYDAIPTSGASIANFDRRIFIVLMGAGMAFLATTNLNADGTVLVKTKAGNDAQISDILGQLNTLTQTVGDHGTFIQALLGRVNSADLFAQGLDSRLGTAEGRITSQGQSITQQGQAITQNKDAQDLLNTQVGQRIDNLVLATGAVGFLPSTLAGNTLTLHLKLADGSVQDEAIDLTSFAQDVRVADVVVDANGFSFTVKNSDNTEKQVNLATLMDNHLTQAFQSKFDAALAASDVLRINTPQALSLVQQSAVLAKFGGASVQQVADVNDRIGAFTGFKQLDGLTDITTVMQGMDTLLVKLAQANAKIAQLQLANRKDEFTNVTLEPGANYFSPFADATVSAPRISPAVRVLNANGYEESFQPITEVVGGIRKLRIDNTDTVARVGMTVSIDW